MAWQDRVESLGQAAKLARVQFRIADSTADGDKYLSHVIGPPVRIIFASGTLRQFGTRYCAGLTL
ncbi:MAG: hypothetical protein J0H62_09885 [Rhizobiales bacterium]|nr:hypothetical protein [Hyphomicrobiales bacterium]